MNVQLLKSKMDSFFAEVSPEYLVSEFEKMGYSFIECEIPWNKVPQYQAAICEFEEKPSWWGIFRSKDKKKCKNKATSDYPGSFFYRKIAV